MKFLTIVGLNLKLTLLFENKNIIEKFWKIAYTYNPQMYIYGTMVHNSCSLIKMSRYNFSNSKYTMGHNWSLFET